jgi:hypothetical protein
VDDLVMTEERIAMQHTEIDHHGPEHEAIAEFRQDIGLLLAEILDLFHDAQPVAAGKQWTIPMVMSCGLKVRVIFQVDSLGDCADKIDD